MDKFNDIINSGQLVLAVNRTLTHKKGMLCEGIVKYGIKL